MSLREHLDAIYRAERTIREEEAQLLGAADRQGLMRLLREAVDEARSLRDRREAAMRIERLADLCAQVPGPEMIDALILMLDDDDPGVRVAPGEALVDVGYERYAEVARGIERALEAKRGGPAMSELPWILAEIAEPSALPLIRRFLGHDEGDVVAAAVEALVHLGEPDAIKVLEPLKNDKREVTLADGDEEFTTTLGELVTEAIDELEALAER